ncbi:MAG: hypothetical protein WCP85_11435 [Mariniphaga sp.]
MKNYYLIICFLSCLIISAAPAGKFPEAKISNGILTTHFYLPDFNNGYYRATRFDWSGLITNLDFKGHQYFGQWYEKYDPEIHDAVMGPVEEFGQIGYTDVKPGGTFIKIGVGALLKPDDSPYSSFKLYKITNHGKWKIKTKSDQVQFTHELKEGEYSYAYNKTINLVKGKPELVIQHTLKNTGTKTLETTVYNHNFMMIDHLLTGPGYIVRFPSNVTAEGRGFNDIARIEGKQMTFLREVSKLESLYCGAMQGLNNDRSSYDFRIENLKAGAGVHITADQPVFKLAFWSNTTTVCPEPFIQIKVEPGKEFKWEIRYEFYTIEMGK